MNHEKNVNNNRAPVSAQDAAGTEGCLFNGIDPALINQIVEDSSTGLVICDLDTYDLLYANKIMREWTNVDEADLTNMKCHAFLLGKDTPCPDCHAQAMPFDGHTVNEFDAESGCHFSVKGKNTKWKGRRIHVEYITNQTKLYSEKHTLEDMISRLPGGVGICYLYPDGNVELGYLNDGFYRLTGESREDRRQYAGFSAFDSVHPDDRTKLLKQLQCTIAEDSVVNLDLRLMHKDGQYRWYNIQANVAERTAEKSILYLMYTNINTQKQESLRLTQRFAAILHQHNIRSWRYDIGEHTLLLDNNQSIYNPYRMSGNKVADIPEIQIRQKLCHPEDAGKLREFYKKLDDGAKDVETVVRFMDDQLNCYRFFRCSYTVTAEKDGESGIAIGSAVDITEQIKATRKYEDAVAYRKHIQVENLILSGHCSVRRNEIIEMIDHSGFNLLQRFGNRRDQFFKGMGTLIIDPQIRETFYREFLNEGVVHNYELGIDQHTISCEIVMDDKIKQRLWVNIHINLVKNPEDSGLEGFLTVTDITASKLQEQILKSAVQLDYDYVMVVDADHDRYELYSASNDPSMTTTPQRGAYDEQIKVYARTFVCPEEQHLAYDGMRVATIRKELSDKSEYILQGCMNQPQGVKYKRVRITYMGEDHSRILITRVDVTDIIEAETAKQQELTEALDTAKQATQAKTDFLSRMSHDIRTPLNAMIGTVALAKDDLADQAAMIEHLNTLHSSGYFLLGLINDILDVNKIEKGKLELKPEPFPVTDFINSVEGTIRPLMKEKNIDFVFQMNCGHSLILADRLRYNQIFFNLLSNAAKYTPKGGRVEFTTQALDAPEGFAGVRNYIRDNGIGMSPEYMEHLFEPFSRDMQAEINQTEGSGLGLAIVKSIVDAMGGHISVTSQLGKGTEFIVDLVVPLAEMQMEPDQDITYDESVLNGSQVLLVDDNELNVKIVGKLLEKKGCHITTAENGQIAVDKFADAEKGFFDIILMDVRMPILNGVEATRVIRSLKKADAQTIPIIAMTADAFSEDVNRTARAGMNAHLSKPIEPRILYKTLAGFISQNKRN